MDKNEMGTSPISNIRNSHGSTIASNIYNPESQLLNEMIKDNNNRKLSIVSINSLEGEDYTDHEHERDISNNEEFYNYPFIQKIDELTTEINKGFAFESEDDNEDQKAIINELLFFKKNTHSKIAESVQSEVDTQSSLFTDNETQSEYSIDSATKFDTEPLKSRIWYYKKESNDDNHQAHPNDDMHSFSDEDESGVVDDSAAAIRQLKLHHYVSTNNLRVNKKDNNSIIKRRTTIASTKLRSRINPSKTFDYIRDINDIPLFSNKEFKTEAKANYYISDTTIDNYNTSMLLNMTGDASRKRRSQIASQRARPFSQVIINENSSTITPPLSPNSIKRFSSTNNINTFSNVNNIKQHQLNSPMDLSTRLVLKPENIYSTSVDTNTSNPHTTTNETNVTAYINNPTSDTTDNNTNQLYKVLLMAKDHLFSLGGKIKRTNSIKSFSSRRSSIRKYQKKSKRHSIRSRKRSSRNLTQNINLQDVSEDEITNISSMNNEIDTQKSYNQTLSKKPNNSNNKKTLRKRSSGLSHSRNSSLISASTQRSSLYGKNKIYQNDFSLNYSASNVSDSTGLDLDENKKYEESFDLDLQNNSKNDKLGVYGVCPESFYGEYHEPIASSIDGRSSIFEDYDDEESVVTESENGIGVVTSSYANASEGFESYDVHQKLNVPLPTTTPVSHKSKESQPISTIKNEELIKDMDKKVTDGLKTEEDKEKERKPKNDVKGLVKKLPSFSSMATNHSSDSLTPTITNTVVNEQQEKRTGKEDEKQDLIDPTDGGKSETAADPSTLSESVYGDNKSMTTSSITLAASRLGGNFDIFKSEKRQMDIESNSTYSHFNDNESRFPLEMASMPEGIRESTSYPTVKQIPLPYYRYGVYMYIIDPVIVQTRTMMERMFSAHTIYTITVKLLRPNLPMYRNDSICTFTVHKRYRQFRSFYKEIHKKYKDTINDWPEFPKKTYFDRFDSDTIKKRAFAFSSLMSFISLHPLLYNCPVLLTFLELTGSMHNPLSTVSANISQRQRQHPDGSVIIEKSVVPIKGKTIQFEGRNVAPLIPKIFGSLGRRQYPPGFYGQFQPPQTTTDASSSNASTISSSSNTNIMINRRSMYETPYYNQDFYSSFGKPQLSKIRTTEFLRNRNSLYSNMSINEIERYKIIPGYERDLEASSSKSNNTQTTPKIAPVKPQKSHSTTAVKPPLATVTSSSSQSNIIINSKNSNKIQKSLSTTTLEQKNISPSSSINSTPKLNHTMTTTDVQKETTVQEIITTTADITTTTTINLENKPSPFSSLNIKLTTSPSSIVIPNQMDGQTTTPTTENIEHTKVNSTDKVSSNKQGSHTSTNSNPSNPPPVIPRPRPRPRPSRNYSAMEELDCRPLSRYTHYQQMNEIPGFQHLISEFPKLRSHQNKRYSSIF
ncbi:hypothetical protein BCR36DRAFT_584839 [Piromyces finnis]|uniref:PX domain-containing protein n=1 Tax=Piromyces finnis TaxID=1754191 RepID=A0A1Y1V4S5_9FUNG|nr:hypothetical protein BCR36DRAFT_584839 [Piromyces finnis]|eukprot:ORX47327.1 hypothetical protein BCR36DRAFT_584839 [Piromyces finnis]